MAPNKKKKRTAANSQRGFATTSQPSKNKAVDTLVPDAAAANEAVNNAAHVDAMPSTSINPTEKNTTIQTMTPEELEAHLERSELQQILDTHGTKCRQEIVTQISKLENERRQLRDRDQSDWLATGSWLPQDLVDEVLEAHRDDQAAQTKQLAHDDNAIDDEYLLIRLWVLQKLLLALNFPMCEAAIVHVLELAVTNRILKTDYTWGLPEALEWYALQCPSDTLPNYDGVKISSLQETSFDPRNDTGRDSPSSALTENIDSVPVVPETASAASCPDMDLSPLSSSNSEDEDPEVFVDRYLRLKTSLFRTDWAMKHQDTQELRSRKLTIQNRITKLTRDPLFDNKLADIYWRSQEQELGKELRQDERNRARRNNTPTGGTDENDDSEDGPDLLGTMFETRDEEHQENSNSEIVSVEIVDFGKWIGIQPRKLMEESCKAIDARTRFRFLTLSTSSAFCRQALEITFSSELSFDQTALKSLPAGVSHRTGQGQLKLEMLTIAASNAMQAESYLSCIVLFLISMSDISDRKQHSRLPTVWRVFYNELADRRKCLIDEADRHVLSQLRAMIDRTRAALRAASDGSNSKPELVMRNGGSRTRNQRQSRGISMDEEQTKEMWNKRSTSPLYDKFLQQRKQLPVHRFKYEILDAIVQHQLTIVCADTGAGKSTQIPSFILEQEMGNGHDCRILVTQPRRISAISLARRVSQELGEAHSELGTTKSLIGYAIRLESKTSESTKVTFATTGVLLRMLESDPDLNEIDFLILDEVHERTMDLDLLFIAILRLRQRRTNLRVILMSATVDASKFANYFHGAPILNIPGRTFPVEVKYLEDAIEATLEKRSNVTKRSSGLSSDDDSDALESAGDQATDVTKTSQLHNYSTKTQSILAEMDHYRIDLTLVADLASAIATQPQFVKYSKAILIFLPGIAEIKRLQSMLLSRDDFTHGWVIHLLHSSFSTEDLERAFAVPRNDYRKIVISTNIAETGITIPDVTAVIDTCKEKMMRFNERRQISKLTEVFISRSSARQRKGRAARVQEGLCFHLVTKERYDNVLLEQHIPEMLRLSLQDAILRVKIWNLGPIEETLSAAIDPPTAKNIRRAIDRLREAGALNSKDELTPFGKLLSRLPLEVVLGKMAIFSVIFRCLDAIVTIIAALGSKSAFNSNSRNSSTHPRFAFARGNSDLISTLNAYRSWVKARAAGSAHTFCHKYGLNDANLRSIEDQKIQLLVYLAEAGLLQLTEAERVALNKARHAGQGKQSFEIPARYNQYDQDPVLCAVIALATYPRILRREGRGWRNVYTNQHVYLTPSSTVNQQQETTAKWISFFEAVQAKSGALNVLEASGIPEAVLAVLVGEANFKFYSGVMVLDHGKIKFSVHQWRQLAAVQVLRAQWAAITERCWQSPQLGVTVMDEKLLRTVVQMVVGPGTPTK